MGLFPNSIHQKLYITGLVLLAIGLPLSVFLMSVAQFVLIINWVLEGRIKEKLLNFWKNKPALIFSLIFLLHIVGLIYTSDYQYAFRDIRIKIPLLLLSLVIATSAYLTKRTLQIILLFFIASVGVATFISTYLFLFTDFSDIRQISPFISHIRFSLMICLAIGLLCYKLYKKQYAATWQFILMALSIMWLVFFLFLFESATGIGVLLTLFFFFAILIVVKSQQIHIRLTALLAILVMAGVVFLYINSAFKDYYYVHDYDLNSLPTHTARGYEYYHDTTSAQTENGHLIWIYICYPELEKAWEAHSHYPFYGEDEKGQYLPATLIRYMASKGLKKDADGFKELSQRDIKAIEKGIVSVNFFDIITLRKRIHEILFEYEVYTETGNPNNLSVMMRLEFFKAAVSIIKNNFLIGVGTGDVDKAFKNMYVEMESKLEPKNQRRTHNQYLTIFVAFGFVGFVIFMVALLYPPVKLKRFADYRYLIFFIIAAMSMLTEDTMETQAGVTFFAFFNTLFLFAQDKRA